VTDFSSGSEPVVMPVAPGTYAFKCTIHPQMTGMVLVK
jgi:plastocyanin